MKRPLGEFLLGGPGHNSYAYQSDVYCVRDGQEIIRDLYEDDYAALADNAGELVTDSDRSPQPIFFGESDDEQHCAYCGEYLYGQATEEDEEEPYVDPNLLSFGHDCLSPWPEVEVKLSWAERIRRWFTPSRRLVLFCWLFLSIVLITVFGAVDPLDRLVLTLIQGGR